MNPAVASAAGSTIRALHARRRATSIDLGLGEPTLPPNVAHFEAATRWIAEHGCRYSTNAGDAELRAAIAARYAYPHLASDANVCVTAGSQEAVYVAMRTLVDPARDAVLIVEPAYPVYAKIAAVEGLRCERVSLDARAPDPFDAETILAAVTPQTRLIVICSPCNPTGRVISRATVRRIADGLLARGGEPIYVLHDEIYRELVYTDDVGTFATVYPHTIAVNSLSKSNALTGLRLGWVMAPDDVMPQLVKMHAWITSCASTFAMRVAMEVFRTNDLAAHRPWYATQRAGVVAALRASGLEFIEPDGAFYACVRVGDANLDTLAFARALVDDRDVVAIPGDVFGPTLAGWLRTSFVGDLARIADGYARIAEAATRANAVA
ncbi:MAG: aminotransferase class I/II-fold pyridoxal phosphate-dependent enzyme [Vulcanimicrobiaceae bacterium]